MAQAVGNFLTNPTSSYRAAIITVGDELLSGQYLNTNLQDLSQSLEKETFKSRVILFVRINYSKSVRRLFLVLDKKI